jgi:mono/diheme cytochrome c family protein
LRVVLLIFGALFLLASCTTSAPQHHKNPQAAKGEALYLVSCGACHQSNGQGLEGIAPPLAGTRWASESEERLARIVLHGLRGSITVADKEYNLEMPALGFFNDQDIAAILTYIRAAWGKPAESVSEETIGKIRTQTRERIDSWTVEELLSSP